MISAIVPFVLSVVTAATPTPAPAATSAEPAVRVSLNHQSYNRGDRARVTVRVRDDGYVVVLHTDANGRVRVLFPVDPGDDNFMKAGQDYEIRGRGNRDAFQVTSTGSGTVYAAVSMDPYRVDDFVRNSHWDYARLEEDSTSANDAESAMTNIVEQMANGSHFDYDLATYTVQSSYASTQHAYIVPSSSYSCFYNSWDPWCDGYYPSPSYFSVGIGFGFGDFWGSRPYGYGYGYPRYGYGYGYGGGYYGGGYYGGGYYGGGYYGGGYYGGGYYVPRGYGAAGYGYSVGHGWSYNHRPIILGPGGGYTVGSRGGFGLGSSSVGYRNRGTYVSTRGGTSPLYGVSRFNTQRGPSRGNDSPNRYGRRDTPSAGEQLGFRTRVGNTRPSSDVGGTRPTSRADGGNRGGYQGAGQSHADGQPARVPQRVEPRADSRPTRSEPRSEPRAEPRSEPRSEPRAEPRAEPRSEPRSEPRAEPRAEPRSEPRSEPRAEPRSEPRSEPRAEPRSRPPQRESHDSRGGGGGGGGSRRGGGGGGGGGGRHH